MSLQLDHLETWTEEGERVVLRSDNHGIILVAGDKEETLCKTNDAPNVNKTLESLNEEVEL